MASSKKNLHFKFKAEMIRNLSEIIINTALGLLSLICC